MISTMNTRTGNAQSRGVSQIELEEDAMLTAIGQSSIDEMADKYADRWDEFVESLSRWRSIHQLFRMRQLAQTLADLTKQQEAITTDIQELKKLKNSLITYKGWRTKYDNAIKGLGQALSGLAEAFAAANYKGRVGKSGRKPYNQATAEAIALTHNLTYEDFKTGKFTTKPFYQWQQDFEEERKRILKRQEANLSKMKATDKERKEKELLLNEMQTEKMRLQDQYDITKPYAMGLLVADMFYTLASALQGEIYL